MSYFISKARYFLEEFENHSDARVKDWFMMSSPLTPFLVIISYLYFVQILGPRIMKNREAFNLKIALLVYNAIQVVLSVYLVEEAFRILWLTNEYNFRCMEVNYEDTPKEIKRARTVWLYFITKALDLLDTVFFILRKKTEQVTFLHVYHHTIVFGFSWFIVKYYPGGHVAFFGTVNAFVHAIMYSYYMFTALYPGRSSTLWWKKYLTQLQLVQFVITGVHALSGLLASDCNFPKILIAFGLPQDVFMFLLFVDFYRKSYIKKQMKIDKKYVNSDTIKNTPNGIKRE